MRSQPSAFEGAGRLNRSPNDGGERAAHLRRRHAVGQRAPQRGLREQVERAASVRDRAANRRKASIRRDQPFLNGSVAASALLLTDRKILPRGRLVLARVEDVDEHRMDYEAERFNYATALTGLSG